MSERVFTCAHCRKSFVSAWTQEEALAEKDRDYPQFPLEECAVLCDDCYRRYSEWAKREGLVA
jgi:hypothetical protein